MPAVTARGPDRRRVDHLGPGPFGRCGAGRPDGGRRRLRGRAAPTSTSTAGRGHPAFLWVHPRHLDRYAPPTTGWWGHAAAVRDGGPVPAGRRGAAAAVGTQPIVSLALVECGLDITARAGIGRRAAEVAGPRAICSSTLVEQRCAGPPAAAWSPRASQDGGAATISLEHPQGYAVMQALIERGVVGDYREPGILRFGFTPLYLRPRRHLGRGGDPARRPRLRQSGTGSLPPAKYRHLASRRRPRLRWPHGHCTGQSALEELVERLGDCGTHRPGHLRELPLRLGPGPGRRHAGRRGPRPGRGGGAGDRALGRRPRRTRGPPRRGQRPVRRAPAPSTAASCSAWSGCGRSRSTSRPGSRWSSRAPSTPR